MSIMTSRQALRHLLGDPVMEKIAKHLPDRLDEEPVDIRFAEEPDYGLDHVELAERVRQAVADIDPGAIATDDGERVWLHRGEFLEFVEMLRGELAPILADWTNASSTVFAEDIAAALHDGDFGLARRLLITFHDEIDNMGMVVTLLGTDDDEREGPVDESLSIDEMMQDGIHRLLAALRGPDGVGDGNGDGPRFVRVP